MQRIKMYLATSLLIVGLSMAAAAGDLQTVPNAAPAPPSDPAATSTTAGTTSTNAEPTTTALPAAEQDPSILTLLLGLLFGKP